MGDVLCAKIYVPRHSNSTTPLLKPHQHNHHDTNITNNGRNHDPG